MITSVIKLNIVLLILCFLFCQYKLFQSEQSFILVIIYGVAWNDIILNKPHPELLFKQRTKIFLSLLSSPPVHALKIVCIVNTFPLYIYTYKVCDICITEIQVCAAGNLTVFHYYLLGKISINVCTFKCFSFVRVYVLHGRRCFIFSLKCYMYPYTVYC